MTAKKIGRPSAYSEEMAADICAKLAAGLTLTRICDQEGMPHVGTVWRWTEAHPEFREAYTRAREEMFQRWADETVDIPDSMFGRASSDDIQLAKLRVDTRKWHLAKLVGAYKDRQEITGKDGKDLIPEAASPEETARRLAYILTAGAAQADKEKP